jgi:spermidine synthase
MTVAVSKGKDSQIILKLNGKPDASSQGDLPTQILLGQIPLLLKPDTRSVLVIGLGSGITAGSVLRHPVERVDLVEISPEVVEGSRFFSPHNHDALKDPRLKLHIEDGKTFLKVTPQRYSVIISEPSNPWIAGIGNLFSVEFYQDVRKRLEPSGLVVQWFHTYEMTRFGVP